MSTPKREIWLQDRCIADRLGAALMVFLRRRMLLIGCCLGIAAASLGPALASSGVSLAPVTLPAEDANTVEKLYSVSRDWQFSAQNVVANLSTPLAQVVYYKPSTPKRVLVLAFGAPWESASDAKILAYARQSMRDWTKFADHNHILIFAPVLGGSNFADFRDLTGRFVNPDIFVNALIDGPATKAIPNLDGRFCLHGHSAGAQFGARYLIAHPERLQCAVLSAPSTYPMPLASVRWPFGMAPTASVGSHAAPDQDLWRIAATGAPITVIIGTRDTEHRPDAPGQVGETRLVRGRSWVSQMRALALANHQCPHVSFIEIADTDHNEPLMALAAQRILRKFYAAEASTDATVGRAETRAGVDCAQN